MVLPQGVVDRFNEQQGRGRRCPRPRQAFRQDAFGQVGQTGAKGQEQQRGDHVEQGVHRGDLRGGATRSPALQKEVSG